MIKRQYGTMEVYSVDWESESWLRAIKEFFQGLLISGSGIFLAFGTLGGIYSSIMLYRSFFN